MSCLVHLAPGSGPLAFGLVESLLSLHGLHAKDIVLASHAPSNTSFACAVASSSGLSQEENQRSLSSLLRCMAPGSLLFLHDEKLAEASRQEALLKDVLLSGFSGGQVASTVGGGWVVQASKPAWEVGAKSTLSRKNKPPAAPPAPTERKKWTMAAGDEDELMDDDDLLTDADKKAPLPLPSATDCSTGATKKACKNCSCGRAEMEAAEEKGSGIKLSAEEVAEAAANLPTSACGSVSPISLTL
jgi:hypothetical protein